MSSRAKNFNRVVICGSMSSYSEMLILREGLSDLGIGAVVPDPDDFYVEHSEDDANDLKRKLSMRHITRIRYAKTFGILVVNLDKYGIHSYIGPNTFAEIAIAFSHYKKIYVYQDLPEFYRDELMAWQVIPLKTSIKRLVDDYNSEVKRQQTEALQLRLFE